MDRLMAGGVKWKSHFRVKRPEGCDGPGSSMWVSTGISAQLVDLLSLGSSQHWLDEALENPILLQSPFSLGYFTWGSQAVTIQL